MAAKGARRRLLLLLRHRVYIIYIYIYIYIYQGEMRGGRHDGDALKGARAMRVAERKKSDVRREPAAARYSRRILYYIYGKRDGIDGGGGGGGGDEDYDYIYEEDCICLLYIIMPTVDGRPPRSAERHGRRGGCGRVAAAKRSGARGVKSPPCTA